QLIFGAEPRYPLAQSLLTLPLVLLKYLGLMLIPWGYSYQHSIVFVETPTGIAFLAPFAAIIVIIACLAFIRTRSVTLGAVWFIAMLSLALVAFRQFKPAYLLQERYLYAPSFGICLIVALGIEWVATRFESRSRAIGAALAVLLILVWSVALLRQ